MKKCLRFSITMVIFLTLNFSAKAYTRKDLESIQTGASIAELILSAPFLLSNNISESTFYMSLPAVIPERFIGSALESSNCITEITTLCKCLRLHANPELARKIGIPHPILMNVLPLIICKIIMKSYPKQKDRIKRRIVRAIVMSIIEVLLTSNTNVDNNQYLGNDKLAIQFTRFLGSFLGTLTIRSIAEYIGEKIIQGAKDADTDEVSPSFRFNPKFQS